MSVGETERTGTAAPDVVIGVAVEVPEPFASRVRDLRLEVSGPHVAGIPTHVTLVPPSPVSVDDLPAIRRHLEAVAGSVPQFSLRLEGTDSFQPVTDVVFLKVTAGGDRCETLQRRLRTGPLPVELRFPYHAHVTLAQDVPQADLDRARSELAGAAESFLVDRIVLYVDRGDDSWERHGEFGLQATPPRGDA